MHQMRGACVTAYDADHAGADREKDGYAMTTDDEVAGEEPTVSVLLADDHALVREGTRRLLESEPGIRVVAEAADGQSAVAEASRVQPDVVIMDVAMPGMSGIEATRQIKARLPQIAVLALTAYDDDQYVMALLDAGAAGFLLKDVRGSELIAAVRSVARGEPVLESAIAVRALRHAVSQPPMPAAPPMLSEREMDVLREAARGLPNKDIARRLGVSIRTVHTHLGNIFGKLKVGSRTEAVLLALRRGWVTLDETELPGGSLTPPYPVVPSPSEHLRGSDETQE